MGSTCVPVLRRLRWSVTLCVGQTTGDALGRAVGSGGETARGWRDLAGARGARGDPRPSRVGRPPSERRSQRQRRRGSSEIWAPDPEAPVEAQKHPSLTPPRTETRPERPFE